MTDTYETVTSQCRQCSSLFDYAYRGKARRVCPKCSENNKKRLVKQQQASLRKGLHEPRGQTMASSVMRAAVMTQHEAAVRLGIWESMDKLLATGVLPEPEPISPQAVQQLERRALGKIRKALAPYLKEPNDL